jgi:hypothetical protein
MGASGLGHDPQTGIWEVSERPGSVGGIDGSGHAFERVFDKARTLAILSAEAGEICGTLAALYVANESIGLRLRRR